MNGIPLVRVEAAAGQVASGKDPVPDERPWIYAFLVAPPGVLANGVIQGGALGFLMSTHGIGSQAQSQMIATLALPTIWYFLWSPVTDFFVRRRTWLVVGAFLAAALMLAAFHQKDLSGRGAMGLMLASACCVQLVVSACGGMMGAMRTAESKRTASGFYQAGSMGFGALSAWVLIWMSSRASQNALGLTAAAMIAVPALFAFIAPEQETISTGTLGATMWRVYIEAKATFWRWEALPYIAVLVFPMASGSAIGLLPGVAKQYGVGGDNVAWVNGLVGGLVVAAGSAVVAMIRVRARASVLYLVVALVNCAAMSVLWLGPLAPSTYYVGLLLYLFTVGSCYAMNTAVALEFMGDSGKSGSGRYSVINGLANVPVLYMVLVDGYGGERWGGRGVAAAETVVGGIGAAILLAYFLTLGRAREPIED